MQYVYVIIHMLQHVSSILTVLRVKVFQTKSSPRARYSNIKNLWTRVVANFSWARHKNPVDSMESHQGHILFWMLWSTHKYGRTSMGYPETWIHCRPWAGRTVQLHSGKFYKQDQTTISNTCWFVIYKQNVTEVYKYLTSRKPEFNQSNTSYCDTVDGRDPAPVDG